eukprot:7842052-Pyramimonas_sp.AAC.1
MGLLPGSNQRASQATQHASQKRARGPGTWPPSSFQDEHTPMPHGRPLTLALHMVNGVTQRPQGRRRQK